MNIFEHIHNILKPSVQLPRGFVRNPDFDAVLLAESFGVVPEIVRARDGYNYIYFPKVSADGFDMLRKMGFEPRLHKSHRYVPARFVYRARISNDMPHDAFLVVKSLRDIYNRELLSCVWNPKYKEYVEKYKMNQKTR